MSDKMSGLIWILPDTDGFPEFFLIFFFLGGGGGKISRQQTSMQNFPEWKELITSSYLSLLLTLGLYNVSFKRNQTIFPMISEYCITDLLRVRIQF